MQQLSFGSITVDRVSEIDEMWVDGSWLYPNMEPGTIRRHACELGPRLVEPEHEKLCMSFHSFLVRTGGKNILVDTCNGNHKYRLPTMPWQHMLQSHLYLENLARLGLCPKQIDVVMCTHLHTDHVGWNTRLLDGRWVPTFPNARYVIAKQEFDHYARMHRERPDARVGHGSFQDSVLPVVEAGLADFVDMHHLVDGTLDEGVWMEPACGHTPGHVTIHVKGGGQEAIMSGDIVHHPIVLIEQGLTNMGDFDQDMARQTRKRLLERCSGSSALLLAMHVPSPTAGRIEAHGARFKFSFLE
ncbi:MBL fold metallo-hydrolase [Variovorax sp. LARHSF232]